MGPPGRFRRFEQPRTLYFDKWRAPAGLCLPTVRGPPWSPPSHRHAEEAAAGQARPTAVILHNQVNSWRAVGSLQDSVSSSPDSLLIISVPSSFSARFISAIPSARWELRRPV